MSLSLQPTSWPRRRLLRTVLLVGFLLAAVGLMALLRWGGHLLVATDPLPPRADLLVVLAGSQWAEEARREEAIRLLREGRAEAVLLSVQSIWYLGEYEPEQLRRYLTQRYGEAQMRRILFCPTRARGDSTQEEAEMLRRCLEERGWHAAVVVTSNYHTRRAGIIWREVTANANPPITLAFHGVSDGDFEVEGWWRERRYAKTFFYESTKLVWTCLFE